MLRQLINVSLVTLLLFLMVSFGLAQSKSAPSPNPQPSVVISESTQDIFLTVPGTRIALSIPKNGFLKSAPLFSGGSTANPRHFIFEDKGSQVFLSGWFEPDKRFTGVKEPPVGKLGDITLHHSNVVFGKVGVWDTIAYDVQNPKIVQANLSANLVKAGTWIELHLSTTQNLTASEQHDLLVKVLRSIRVHEMTDEMLKGFDLLIGRVRGAIRSRLEKGEGCLPWASLVIDPNDSKPIYDLAFTPERLKQVSGTSAEAIWSHLTAVAKRTPFTLSGIGICETDPSVGNSAEPNVITLILERREGSAIKMRFPFERSAKGQVSYIENKESVELTTPVVFTSP